MAKKTVKLDNPEDRFKSRVTTGRSLFLEDVDQRSGTVRRFRDLIAGISADLGGAEILTEAERQLIRRAAALSVQCELAELAMARGEPVDWDNYRAHTNALRRVLTDLGLERRAKDVTPPLNVYITGQTDA
nr:hypothetical protein 3 [Rhodospirillaceae bacterium]